MRRLEEAARLRLYPSGGPLLVLHQLLDFANAGHGGLPDVLAEARFTTLCQLLDALPPFKRIPQLALEPGTLDEIEALKPECELGHAHRRSGAS